MSLVSNSRDWPKADIAINLRVFPGRVYGDNLSHYPQETQLKFPKFFGPDKTRKYGRASVPMSEYWQKL